MMARLYGCFCTIALLVLMPGGGSGNVPAKGKVTFSDNDEPLTQGSVAFLKDGKISRGDIQPDGTYVVFTGTGTDNGLPPGQYKVYITGSDKVIPIAGSEGSNDYEPQIAKKYESEETSGLTAEVGSSTKEYNFKVERFKK
jgi:hypothetical protein